MPRDAIRRRPPRRAVANQLNDRDEADEVQESCVRGEITPDRKKVYLKAFLVWILFTAGGWLSIPDQFLPLFSHCVGFGFFLTITTRKTRWLGAIAVGGLMFTYLMYQTMPMDYIVTVTQSAGYLTLATFVILASLWRVAPKEMRDDFIQGGNDMIKHGPRYLSDALESFPRELRSQFEKQRQISPGAKNPQQQPSIEMAAKLAEYSKALLDLDEQMIAMSQKLKSAELVLEKMNATLQDEVAKRLRAEHALVEKQDKLSGANKQIKSLQEKLKQTDTALLMQKLRQEKAKTQEMEARKFKLSDELSIEKNTRALIQKQISLLECDNQKLVKECNKLRETARQALSDEKDHDQKYMSERAQKELALKDNKNLRERCERLQSILDRMNNDFKSEQALLKHEYESQLAEERKLANRLRLIQGEQTENLSLQELASLEEEQECALRRIRAIRSQRQEEEASRLRMAHEELQDKMLCRVCLNDQISIALVPCGHFCLCKGCAKRMKDCPLCRTTIQETKEIFVC